QLLALTNRFTRRVDGQPPAIHQIRMALFDKGWDMTELHRDATGYMTRATTRNTPDISLDRSHALTVWLQQNQVALAAPNAVETFVMPDTFTFDDGGSQQTVQFLGTLSRNGPPVAWLTESGQSIATAFGAGVATTFNTLTCGGCHSGAARGVSSDVFQVAPGSSLADGTDRLSLFMRDPSKPDDPANPPDELRRRAGDLQHLLCGGAQTQVTFIIDDADITQVGQDIAIVGNIADLGNWSFAAGGLRLDGRGFPTWAGTVTLARNASFEFKAIEVQGTQTLRWENGDNRTVQLPNVDAVAIRGSFRR
ncbi:MAG: carbohydrate-binding module family 20 domain-containing protein, partial [Polyangia bacterium]